MSSFIQSRLYPLSSGKERQVLFWYMDSITGEAIIKSKNFIDKVDIATATPAVCIICFGLPKFKQRAAR
jgi:hypothetical protein